MKTKLVEYSKSNMKHTGGVTPARRLIRARVSLLAILIAGLLSAVLVGCGGQPVVTPPPPTATLVTEPGTATPSATNEVAPSAMDAVAAQTRHLQGEPSAPVTIVEFGDFQ